MATRQDGEVKSESTARSGRRGFAGMDPALQREIARQGGRAAHEKGVAHRFTSQEARAAGRIGGQHSHGRKRARQEAEQAAQGASPDHAAQMEAPHREREADSIEQARESGVPDQE